MKQLASRKKLEEHAKDTIVEGWTDKRYKSFIISLLRSGFRRFPNKHKVLLESRLPEKKLNIKTGRVGFHHRCAECKGEFPSKEVQVDHISPIVDPYYGFIDFDSFIKRLFCSVHNLQVLCKACHKIKTDKENNKRKKSNADSTKSK
jgi:5-methylcytosine-specific restriction endonuclease McrA